MPILLAFKQGLYIFCFYKIIQILPFSGFLEPCTNGNVSGYYSYLKSGTLFQEASFYPLATGI
jgi:hypothetical protein